MRFYTQQHRHYCGIDLHARSLYVCVLDKAGKTLVHQKLACERDELLRVLRPYRKDLVAPSSASSAGTGSPTSAKRRESIEFVLGHALDMKAIHGIQNTNTQYNLPPFDERIDKTEDRGAVITHFDEGSIEMSMRPTSLCWAPMTRSSAISSSTFFMRSGRTTDTTSPSCARSQESAKSWR
jgi:hypothetical protein